MKTRFILFIFYFACLFQPLVYARSRESRLTYDVTGSQTNINGRTYQELNVAANWFASDWLIWRNSAFQRQAQDEDTVYGLDTSLRLQQEWTNSKRTLGFRIFGGPGARFASRRYDAYFGEAGVGIRLGGLLLSGGVKSYRYKNDREDNAGVRLPRNENHVFVTISGGGTL